MKKMIFALLCLSIPAWAYVPSAGFLIKTLASKHTSPKGVRFRGTLQKFEGESPVGARFKVTTVFKEDNSTARIWVSDENGKQLYITERKYDGGLQPLSVPANAIVQILMDSNPLHISDALKKEGVDLSGAETPGASHLNETQEGGLAKKEFLARWNKSFAWVIGQKKTPDAKVESQLWLEKDTFYPVRLLLSSVSHELQFENFKYFHDFPFPRQISVIQDKQVLLRIEFQDLTKSPTTDLAAFKNPITSGFTDLGNASAEGVRRLVLQFIEGMPH